MADKAFQLLTHVRKEDSAWNGNFCKLVDQQPLLLSVVSGRALVSDLNAKPVGCVSNADHSAQIVAKLQSGEILMAKTIGRCFCTARTIYVWSEGISDEERRNESARLAGEIKIPKPLRTPPVPEKV